MKITKIETHVCHARMRNWIFVKVLTDQDGLWGWGEATLEWHTRAVVGAVEDLAELVVGEDPTRVEHLWQMMHRQHFWHGNGVVRGTAASGIDIALWDIVGKIHGGTRFAPIATWGAGGWRISTSSIRPMRDASAS
jgi:galactonate dehydratase